MASWTVGVEGQSTVNTALRRVGGRRVGGRAGALVAAAAVTGVVAGSVTVTAHAQPATGTPRAGAVVRTTSGAVRGTLTLSYRAFQGIPYAATTAGRQRWRAPRPAPKWSGVRNGKRPGPDCPQTAVAWRPAAASYHENCLVLNVWTPRRVTARSHLPVAVWFHGGGFTNGAGRDFRPTRFVGHGAVVVTVNYRLGAFGWLDLPGLAGESKSSSSGNYGLLDQVQALRWVKANVARFGGDPDQVMIAGQSAGAESVCALLASPRAAGLFQRAVVESGLSCSVNTHTQARAAGRQFARAAGCKGKGAQLVACLRRKTPAELIDAQQAAGSWRPTVDAEVLPEAPSDAFADGSFSHVPVLIGGTSHETRAFVYEGNDLINHPVTAAEYRQQVREQFGSATPEVLRRYPLKSYSVPGAALAAVTTDSGFSCPELENAASLSKYVRTYVYEFRDRTAPLRPYELVPPSFSLATQHSAELPYLWGSNTATPLTARQRRLANEMVHYWRAFDATGYMRAGALPDVPRYNPAHAREVAFYAAGPRLVSNMYREHQCGFWRSASTG